MSAAVIAKQRFTGTLSLSQPQPQCAAPAPPKEIEENHRMANLALVVRAQLPEIFNDNSPSALPQGIHARLLALGIPGGEANVLINCWVHRPEYQKGRAKRRIQRFQLDDERIARRVAGLALLAELAPKIFNYAAPRPLAIGIDRQIIELGMDPETTGDVLRWWTN